jgi:copper chaperone CopZ
MERAVIRLQISGMTCAHCVSAVERALHEVPGVESATVDLRSETATVEGNADIGALIAAVEEEGYQASPAIQ